MINPRIYGPLVVLFSGLLVVGPLPAQDPSEGAVSGQLADQEVTLRPGDLLRVIVWPNDDLSGEFPIQRSGNVNLPFLGEVQAAGVSLDSLRDRLRAGYEEMVKNPVITVTPVFRVGVLGNVRQPGIYQVTPSEGLFDVIGMAGGFGPRANEEQVRIVRRDQVLEVNALRALQEGTAGLDQYQLRSGDQVVVPPRDPGITFGNVVTWIQTGATIWFLVDRARN